MSEMSGVSESLGDLPRIAVGYADDVAGKGPLQNRIARLVSRALRDARRDRGLTRAVIAERMSAELGRAVSEDMLEKWASEASEAHRIPLDAFMVLTRATGALELAGVVPAFVDLIAVPRRYEAVIELHLIEQREAELAARKARIQATLRGQS